MSPKTRIAIRRYGEQACRDAFFIYKTFPQLDALTPMLTTVHPGKFRSPRQVRAAINAGRELKAVEERR